MNHILGYVKDDNPNNTTQFIDYEGKAKPENVKKINYYKKLNELGWKRRMKTKHGDLPTTKVQVNPQLPESISVIS